MKTRPKTRPPKKFWDKIFESIAIMGLLIGIYLAIQAWSNLPTTIPIHFDAAGNADGFGPKGMIWLLPAIGVVMVPAMLFLRRVPLLSNLPFGITEENASYPSGLIIGLLSLLACFVSLLFWLLVYDTISIAFGGSSLLGWLFMPIFLTGIMGPIIWYFIATLRGQ